MLTYELVHEALWLLHGPASEHLCIACGAPAANWAFQHPREGVLVDALGRYYSADIGAYAPMCVSCHFRLDHEKTPERWGDSLGRAGRAKAMRCQTDARYAARIRGAAAENLAKGRASRLEKLRSDAEFARENREVLERARAVQAERRRTVPGYAFHMSRGIREGAAKGRERINAMRRSCVGCGLESTPAGLASHQRVSGHKGYTERKETNP